LDFPGTAEHQPVADPLLHRLDGGVLGLDELGELSELLGLLLNRPRGTAGGYFKKNYAAMARYTTSQSS